MIAVDRDHLAQLLAAALLEQLEVLRIHRIGARVPVTFGTETALAPEAVLRPEQHAQTVARIGEGRVMRIMRAADEVEPGLLDQLHVPEATGAGRGDAPAGAVLMDVGAAQVEVLAIEEEAAVGGPFKPSETERRYAFVQNPIAVVNERADGVEVRVLRMPQRGIEDRMGRLIEALNLPGVDIIKRLDLRHQTIARINDLSLHRTDLYLITVILNFGFDLNA